MFTEIPLHSKLEYDSIFPVYGMKKRAIQNLQAINGSRAIECKPVNLDSQWISRGSWEPQPIRWSPGLRGANGETGPSNIVVGFSFAGK